MVYQINILMYVFSLVLLILLESTFLAGENSSEQKAFRSVFHYAYILFASQIAWNILDGRIFEGSFVVNYVLCGISAAATTMCSFKWFCYYERLTNPKKNFFLNSQYFSFDSFGYFHCINCHNIYYKMDFLHWQ